LSLTQKLYSFAGSSHSLRFINAEDYFSVKEDFGYLPGLSPDGFVDQLALLGK
jgi:hypothetical protein